MSDEFEPGDERNIMLRELRIIEYIDPDGGLHTVDLSQGTGGDELLESDYADMVAWAAAYGIASKVAAILAGDESDYDDVE